MYTCMNVCMHAYFAYHLKSYLYITVKECFGGQFGALLAELTLSDFMLQPLSPTGFWDYPSAYPDMRGPKTLMTNSSNMHS